MANPCVHIEALGLCEHCSKLQNMSSFPPEAMNAEWRCKGCNGILSHKSFGYLSKKGGKHRWVGPGKQWVDKRPTEEFEIDGLNVILKNPTLLI